MSSPNNYSASRIGAGKLQLLPHIPSPTQRPVLVNKVLLTCSHANSFTVDLLQQQSSEAAREITGLADPKMYAQYLLR